MNHTYLQQDRLVEEFLKTVEPNYNAALDKLVNGKIDAECIYTMAGFLAYVTTCSPAGMRIQSGPLKSTVETTAILMEEQGLFSLPPAELAGASLAALLEKGVVHMKIDPWFQVRSATRFSAS